ncbi:MAG: T9SS type A sorting domain-containing protein [Soonwooa sp.]
MPRPTQFNITVPTSEIYWDGALSYWAIDLFDLTGRLFSNGEIIDSKIDVKKLNAGVYYLVIKPDTKSETLGFIKN